MRRMSSIRFFVLSLACCGILGCGEAGQGTRSSAGPPAGRKADGVGGKRAGGREKGQPAARDGLAVAAALRHANLAIFPVISSVERNMDRYTTLDEGLEKGTVKVFEVGANVEDPQDGDGEAEEAGTPQPAANQQAEEAVRGDVNRLMVLNTSGKPLYLMPGEIIIGGKQDRTIARERIIASGTKPVAIDVFCVEHGRWAGRGEGGYEALACMLGGVEAPEEIAKAARRADRGEFVASGINVSKPTRVSVQKEKGQSEVWDAVSTTLAAGAVESESSTFVENYASPENRGKFKAYLEPLEKAVGSQQRIVGVVVAINGKTHSADVFESTPLFRKLWPKLLRSYALDAANAADGGQDARGCSVAEAGAFLDKSLSGEIQKTEAREGLVLRTRSVEGVASFSCVRADDADFVNGDADAMTDDAETAAMGGGLGGVHTSAFAE